MTGLKKPDIRSGYTSPGVLAASTPTGTSTLPSLSQLRLNHQYKPEGGKGALVRPI